MPKPRVSLKTYQFLINIFKLEKCLIGKLLYKSASMCCSGRALCRNDGVGNGITEIWISICWDQELTLLRKRGAPESGMHFGKTPEKSILFLLCYWQAKRNTSHLKPLSQSFKNIYHPRCKENSKGVLGAWDLKQDAGHLQRPGRVPRGCANPILSYCESAFIYLLFFCSHSP